MNSIRLDTSSLPSSIRLEGNIPNQIYIDGIDFITRLTQTMYELIGELDRVGRKHTAEKKIVAITDYHINANGMIVRDIFDNIVKIEKGIAEFHQFSTEYEEFDNMVGNYAVGIVEHKDGTIETVPVEHLQFIKSIDEYFDKREEITKEQFNVLLESTIIAEKDRLIEVGAKEILVDEELYKKHCGDQIGLKWRINIADKKLPEHYIDLQIRLVKNLKGYIVIIK